MSKDKKDLLTTDLLKNKIYQALSTYKDKYLATDLVTAGCIQELIIHSRQIILNIKFGYLLAAHFKIVEQNLYSLLQPIITDLGSEVGIELILEINIFSEISRHQHKNKLNQIPNIKNIIAVSSGKGGVGKSTVSVNLAITLQQQGAKVGLLDADFYGPSLPHMLGDQDHKVLNMNGKKFQPNYTYGIYYISIGNLLEVDSPLVWRGPMVSSALLQLLHNTLWPELDYLIIDLPPGTGDIHLTMAQKIPITAAIIVTTPQTVALLDAQKALLMLQKVEIPVLGVIENMSFFLCDNCQHEHSIFGSNGGLNLANKYGLRLLGKIPLDLNIMRQSDLGVPTVAAFPAGKSSQIYNDVASCTAAQLSLLPVDLNLPDLSIIVD